MAFSSAPTAASERAGSDCAWRGRRHSTSETRDELLGVLNNFVCLGAALPRLLGVDEHT